MKFVFVSKKKKSYSYDDGSGVDSRNFKGYLSLVEEFDCE